MPGMILISRRVRIQYLPKGAKDVSSAKPKAEIQSIGKVCVLSSCQKASEMFRQPLLNYIHIHCIGLLRRA